MNWDTTKITAISHMALPLEATNSAPRVSWTFWMLSWIFLM